MNKYIFTIVLFFTYLCTRTVHSQFICNDLVCCPENCDNCTTCVGIIEYDDLCCEKIILQNNMTCDDFTPPCILTNTTNTTDANIPVPDKAELDLNGKILAFLTLTNIILLSAGFIIFICSIYACTCFDKRVPPLNYTDITWKEGTSWIKDN